VTHTNALPKLRRTQALSITTLAWHQRHQLTIRGIHITIEAMPAVHGVNPLSAWFAGGVNGYWLSIATPQAVRSFYVTGDTVTATPVLQAIQGRSVDVLIPNMGAAKQGSWIMCLTLSAAMLKMLKEHLSPKVTIPVHFGTFEHYVEPIAKVARWHDDTIQILAPGQRCQLTIEST